MLASAARSRQEAARTSKRSQAWASYVLRLPSEDRELEDIEAVANFLFDKPCFQLLPRKQLLNLGKHGRLHIFRRGAAVPLPHQASLWILRGQLGRFPFLAAGTRARSWFSGHLPLFEEWLVKTAWAAAGFGAARPAQCFGAGEVLTGVLRDGLPEDEEQEKLLPQTLQLNLDSHTWHCYVAMEHTHAILLEEGGNTLWNAPPSPSHGEQKRAAGGRLVSRESLADSSPGSRQVSKKVAQKAALAKETVHQIIYATKGVQPQGETSAGMLGTFYRHGEVLLQKGTKLNAALFLTDGVLRVTARVPGPGPRAQVLELDQLLPGTWLDIQTALKGGTCDFTFSVASETGARVLEVPLETFKKQVMPFLAKDFLQEEKEREASWAAVFTTMRPRPSTAPAERPGGRRGYLLPHGAEKSCTSVLAQIASARRQPMSKKVSAPLPAHESDGYLGLAAFVPLSGLRERKGPSQSQGPAPVPPQKQAPAQVPTSPSLRSSQAEAERRQAKIQVAEVQPKARMDTLFLPQPSSANWKESSGYRLLETEGVFMPEVRYGTSATSDVASVSRDESLRSLGLRESQWSQEGEEVTDGSESVTTQVRRSINLTLPVPVEEITDIASDLGIRQLTHQSIAASDEEGYQNQLLSIKDYGLLLTLNDPETPTAHNSKTKSKARFASRARSLRPSSARPPLHRKLLAFETGEEVKKSRPSSALLASFRVRALRRGSCTSRPVSASPAGKSRTELVQICQPVQAAARAGE